jgi:hypothetical protein
MLMKEQVALIETTSDGEEITETSRKTVFCDQLPVYSSDFRAAQAAGVKVEGGLKLRAIEYSGELVVYYKNKFFAVDRTYQPTDDWIELYLTNGRTVL